MLGATLHRIYGQVPQREADNYQGRKAIKLPLHLSSVCGERDALLNKYYLVKVQILDDVKNHQVSVF
jgi:hypothetical protein